MKVFSLISLACLFISCSASADRCGKSPIKVAILDTGFGFEDRGHEANLCKYGHKDFTRDGQFSSAYVTSSPVPIDFNGHGTNIAGIIDRYAKQAHINYCLVIVKYYSAQQTDTQNIASSAKAIQYAANIKADFINYSGGGPKSDLSEKIAIMHFLNGGGKFVAAAGNEHEDLNAPDCAYYPAMEDPRIIVVGNYDKNGTPAESSNYGIRVNRWEIGMGVKAFGLTMSGTSQATAAVTGKIVAESNNRCDIGL